MAWRGLNAAEKNLSEIVEAVRQLGFGRSYASGFSQLASGKIATFSGLVGGADYSPGTYPAVPLIGGTGTGATANITVNGAQTVSAVTLVNGGIGYTVGDVLTSAQIPGTAFAGGVRTFGSLVGGSGYTDGFYVGDFLTGGSGSGDLQADVTVSGGAVTSVVVNQPGTFYGLGDVFGDGGTIGPGSGFQVSAAAMTGTGFSIHVATLAATLTTVVPAINCSESCAVFVNPANAVAAALTPWPYVKMTDIKNGQFTITHPSAAGAAFVQWVAFG